MARYPHHDPYGAGRPGGAERVLRPAVRPIRQQGGTAAAIPLYRHTATTKPAAPPAQADDPYAIFGASWPRIAFALLGIYLYSGARISLNSQGADPSLGSFDPINTLLQLVILLGSTALILRGWRRCLPLIRPAWPFILVLGVLFASASWSQSPEHTIRRCVSMTGMMLYVTSTYADFGARRFMRLVLAAMLILIGLSIMEVVLRPAVGFDVGEYANAIRGVFTQKNAFGMNLMGGALALSFIVLERGFVRPRDIAMLLMLLALLVLSRSTTSLLLTLFATATTVAIVGIRKDSAWRAATLLGMGMGLTIGVLFFAAVGVEGLFDLIGKDSSLTGRVYIWAAVGDLIQQRPLLGYGYSAFWINGTRGVQYVWDTVEWEAPTAHSGYLEILLQLGALGIALVIVVTVVTSWRAIVAMARGQAGRAIWMLMLLIILSILSYSESALLNPDMTMLYLMVGTMALLETGERPKQTPLHRAPAMLFRRNGVRWPFFHRS